MGLAHKKQQTIFDFCFSKTKFFGADVLPANIMAKTDILYLLVLLGFFIFLSCPFKFSFLFSSGPQVLWLLLEISPLTSHASTIYCSGGVSLDTSHDY